MSESNVIEFIPREEYERAVEEHVNTVFGGLASSPDRRLNIPKNQNFSRKDVVLAFQNAFEAIGGTTRLAMWANEHPTEFYKIYARLLPSQASQALGEENVHRVVHVLPRSALDE